MYASVTPPNQSLQQTGHPPRDRLHQEDLQCRCRRVGVAGPQLSSTVRCTMKAIATLSRWAGAITLVALLGWSAASHWYSVTWMSKPTPELYQYVVGSGYGIVYVHYVHTPAWIGGTARFHRLPGFRRHSVSFRWWFRFIDSAPPPFTGIEIPLWAPILVLAVLCGYMWWGRVRRVPGTCSRCGYPAGSSPACSECGHPLSPAAQPRGT